MSTIENIANGPVIVVDDQIINTETGEVVPEATLDEIEAIIAEYEARYGMISDEFVQARQDGIFTEDSFEVMDWSMFLKRLKKEKCSHLGRLQPHYIFER